MTQEQKQMFGIKEGDTNKTKMKKIDTFVSNNWRTLQNGARLLGALKYSGEIINNNVRLDFQIESVKTPIYHWNRGTWKGEIPDAIVNTAAYTIEKLMCVR